MSVSGEQRLWQQVLLVALNDLQSTGAIAHENRSFAARWVGRYPGRDFRMVCDLAGFDPDSVHAHFRDIADQHYPAGARAAHSKAQASHRPQLMPAPPFVSSARRA